MKLSVITVSDQKLKLFEYFPDGDLKGVILFCHGFPGTVRMHNLGGKLNGLGYAMVELRYRGDQESEGRFSFIGSIADVEAAAQYIEHTYPTTPLVALGYSAGGMYVVNAALADPELFDNIVLLNPLLDTGFLAADNPIMHELWQEAKEYLRLKSWEEYEEEVAVVQEHHNPVAFADNIKTPTTIVQSDRDEIVSPSIAESFFNKLKCKKQFLWIRNGTHGLSGEEKEIIDAITQ